MLKDQDTLGLRAAKDQGSLAPRDSLAPKALGNLYFSSGNFVDNLSEEVGSSGSLGSEAGSALCLAQSSFRIGLKTDLQVNQAKIGPHLP